ncbi:sensor histidine kinase [Plantactinospora sp. B5E13]|uniref:sensor histidine kinase n=1 Tax=unclassified Plantactinospora TaxID=2631981 RepID=UPI00325CC7AC
MHPLRLAIGVVTVISVGFPLTPLVLVGPMGTPFQVGVMLASLVVFYVPYLRQIRLAFRGSPEGGFTVDLAVLVLAAYLPMLWLGAFWTSVPHILSAVVLLRLRAPWKMVLFIPIALGQGALGYIGVETSPLNIYNGLYALLTVIVAGSVIYAAVRLVTVTRELQQARADLAEAAVLKERLRISRDLHDGLGRSLTAIALKGDLSRRLLDHDPEEARVELSELVKVARDAAQDVRQVARGYREVSLAQEVPRAVSLLTSSGVACTANVGVAGLPRSSDEALAWAVREGVTNVLRHSRATTCSITTSVRGGRVRLEIVNDGALAPDRGGPAGSGLTGLSERAATLGGQVEFARTEGGGFRMLMDVPSA